MQQQQQGQQQPSPQQLQQQQHQHQQQQQHGMVGPGNDINQVSKIRFRNQYSEFHFSFMFSLRFLFPSNFVY